MRRNRARQPRLRPRVFAAAILTGAALAVTACGSAAIPMASDAAQNCRSSNEQLASIAAQANQVRAAAEANPVVAANGFAGLAAITADLPDCSEVASRRARGRLLRALPHGELRFFRGWRRPSREPGAGGSRGCHARASAHRAGGFSSLAVGRGVPVRRGRVPVGRGDPQPALADTRIVWNCRTRRGR